jgi:hypothetical protein
MHFTQMRDTLKSYHHFGVWEGVFALPFYAFFVSCSPVPDLWYCGGLPRPLGRNAGSIVKNPTSFLSLEYPYDF